MHGRTVATSPVGIKPMHYKPEDLKLVPLKAVAPGTVAQIMRRADIPLVWRLEDTTEETSRILVLGGEYSFEAFEWSGDALVRIVCNPNDVRFSLGKPSPDLDPRTVGALVVREGGAFINAKPKRDAGYRNQKIDIADFSEAEFSGPMDDYLAFTEWESGTVNQHDGFKPIFSNKKA
jgi:hypothetical protein